MKKEWSEEELKGVADQLSNPQGTDGVKTGERMNLSNANMTSRAIESLEINDHDIVLEIGPGNGAHAGSVISRAQNVKYHGVDISETMVLEAGKLNENLVLQGTAVFSITDGKKLEFAADYFDKIVTVNTVYFWQNPAEYAAEILRVLKSGGLFALTFSDKSFMEKLPFTKFGFQLYDRDNAENLLQQAGFEICKIIEEVEIIRGSLGEEVERPICIIVGKK